MNKWIALAKRIWPGISSNEADVLLWSCTTYPVGSDTEVEHALKDAYMKSGGDVFQALVLADQELTAKQTQQ